MADFVTMTEDVIEHVHVSVPPSPQQSQSQSQSLHITSPSQSQSQSLHITSPSQSLHITSPSQSLHITSPSQSQSQSLHITAPSQSQSQSLHITAPSLSPFVNTGDDEKDSGALSMSVCGKRTEGDMRYEEQIKQCNVNNTFSVVDVDSFSPVRNLLKIDIPAKKNQDRGRHWVLNRDSAQGSVGIGVYAVADGHGRRGDSMAESVMCSLHTALTGPSTTTDVWGEDDLTAALQGLFHGAEQECTALFGDFDGGATLSVCVDRPGRDMWVAHVGDSDICLVELATDACNASMITEDHSPLNMDEFLRMVALCPSANFEYDRQRKDAPHLHIYAQSPQEPCGWKKNPSPKRNVYYKNRANDLASYVSEGGGCASLANTRAIGDFRMKRAVALSAQPFIMRHPALNSSKRLIVASDGFWDSWPTDELLLFCQKHKNFHDVVEALERTHVNTTNKYFGSCSDDTFLYFIQPNDDPPL